MSRWLFDLGNTRLKCARMDADGRVVDVVAFGHDAAQFAEALRAHVPDDAESACLASVASPALRAAVIEVLGGRFQRISIARTQARFGGVEIAYARPEKLGVDRFLALLAARVRGHEDWLIAGIGTAITIDLLDHDGRHHGGRIAPSPRLMREALHAAAAQLPDTGGRYVEFADDTEDALASGCEGAAIGVIEHSRRRAEARLGRRPRLLLHGGGSDALLEHLPGAEHAPSLVLEGLAHWARAGIEP